MIDNATTAYLRGCRPDRSFGDDVRNMALFMADAPLAGYFLAAGE